MADRLDTPQIQSALAGLEGGPVERSLVAIHVGASHLLGIESSDIAIGGVVDETAVQNLIEQYWLTGGPDPDLIARVRLTDLWLGFYQLGRDLALVRTELLDSLHQSQLGRRMALLTGHNIDPSLVDTTVEDLIAASSVEPIDEHSYVPLPLDVPGSHLGYLLALYILDSTNILQSLTSFEIGAAFNNSPWDARNAGGVDCSQRNHLSWISTHGYPDQGGGVPHWVRDVIVLGGGRFFGASAGSIPSWFATVESDDELRAITQMTYNPPEFTCRVLDNYTLALGVNMTLPSDGEKILIEWRYQLDDVLSRAHLSLLLSVGAVRLDIYQIDFEANLAYKFSTALHFSAGFVCDLHEYIDENDFPPDSTSLGYEFTKERRLAEMSQVERSAFETLNLSIEAFRNRPGTRLGRAFHSYLRAQHSTASASFGGVPPILRPLKVAREELRQAISADRSNPPDVDLSLLGEGRAYIQFRIAFDRLARMTAYVAYLDSSCILKTALFSFDVAFDIGWGVEQQSEALAFGFASLTRLKADGVRSFAINAHSATYNFPFHEAMLRLGFEEASYTHRAHTLAEHGGSLLTHRLVAIGYAGAGDDYIAAVDWELRIVAELCRDDVADSLPGKLPSIVHVAGHGQVGGNSYEIGIKMTDGDEPLTPARVLLDFDASKTDLVFLSACSTGRSELAQMQLSDAIPMDVAFIEAGARVVLSTAAPINDFIAALFAAVFYDALSSGSTIWESYVAARFAARTGSIPSDVGRLRSLLDRHWPDWIVNTTDGLRSSPDDWQRFRLSGRFWD